MILFTMLLFTILALIIVTGIVIVTGGSIFMLVFGDLIVCVAIIVWLIRRKKKG